MSFNPASGSTAEILYTDEQATLADGVSIDSGWLDMADYDKVQFTGAASTPGMTMTIVSRMEDGGAELSTPTTYNDGNLYLFNIICRERYMKFLWTNNTGSGVTDARMQIKGTIGSSDKLSVFPVGVNPSDFSQAALVQSINRGRQPDGDYVAVPADGTALNETTLLSGGATFVSDWIDSDGYSDIQIFVTSDVISAVRGLLVEYTDDVQAGSPTVQASQTFTFSAVDIERGYLRLNVEPLLDGFRVSYTNGATAQSNFLLDVALRTIAQPDNRNEAGALLTANFNTEVALDNVPNYTIDTKFGRNPDVDSGPEDMWANGGNYTGHPTSFTPETVDVFSSSANDTSAGTGARTVRITGLKSNTSEVYETEDIIMNGTTAVTSTNTWWRVNRLEVLTGGSTGNNVGNITVRSTTTTANVFVFCPATFNQSQVGAYTVPYAKKMIIKRIRTSITRANGSAGSATITLRARPSGGVYKAIRAFELQTGAATEFTMEGGIVLPALTDVKYRIETVSDTNTVAEGAFEYILIEV